MSITFNCPSAPKFPKVEFGETVFESALPVVNVTNINAATLCSLLGIDQQFGVLTRDDLPKLILRTKHLLRCSPTRPADFERVTLEHEGNVTRIVRTLTSVTHNEHGTRRRLQDLLALFEAALECGCNVQWG